MCVLPKAEPVHLTISLPHKLLQWCSTVHQHKSKVFYWFGTVQWVLAGSGRRVGSRNIGILHPIRKLAVGTDTYGGPKCRSNIGINDDEATNGMRYISKGAPAENITSKIIVDDVLLYVCTTKYLREYSRTVLDVLKHHHDTLKLKSLKWF